MKKSNLKIMTLIMFGMITYCAVFNLQLGLIKRIMLGYMFLFTPHKWEETRFPGGFSDLMVEFFRAKKTPEQLSASHIPVAVPLLVITYTPFFTQIKVFSLVPIYIGLFETFIRIVGIKPHKMEKPYTPGLTYAWSRICLFVDFFFQKSISQQQRICSDIPLTMACFASMQRTVINS